MRRVSSRRGVHECNSVTRGCNYIFVQTVRIPSKGSETCLDGNGWREVMASLNEHACSKLCFHSDLGARHPIIAVAFVCPMCEAAIQIVSSDLPEAREV